MVNESTLKEFSFTEGKILIATQECSPLDKWIQIEAASIFYDVKVTESSSFINPEEVSCSQFVSTRVEEKALGDAVMKNQPRKEKAVDDDVGRFPAGELNRWKMTDVGWDNVAGKVGSERGGSKHESAGVHLMPVNPRSHACLDDFESRVEDSVDINVEDSVGLEVKDLLELENGSLHGLGPWAQNNLLDPEEVLAQEGTIDFDGVDGHFGLRENKGPVGFGENMGVVGSLPFEPNSFSQLTPMGADSVGQNQLQRGAESLAEDIGRVVEPGGRGDLGRGSQLPSINLVVDLNDVGCRRRR